PRRQEHACEAEPVPEDVECPHVRPQGAPNVGCPSMCVELIAPVTGSTAIRTAPEGSMLGAWHRAQPVMVSEGEWSPSAGGTPWHVPHTACEVPPVQLGVG